MERNGKSIREKAKIMYRIKTSDFLSRNSLNVELLNEDVIKKISDDSFISKTHNLYALYNQKYKLEFSFCKTGQFHYIMIEANSLRRDVNTKIDYKDDILIFHKSKQDIENQFKVKADEVEDKVNIGSMEIHFSEEGVDSLYFFG
jgi:NAD-dependent DNA ligase